MTALLDVRNRQGSKAKWQIEKKTFPRERKQQQMIELQVHDISFVFQLENVLHNAQRKRSHSYSKLCHNISICSMLMVVFTKQFVEF